MWGTTAYYSLLTTVQLYYLLLTAYCLLLTIYLLHRGTAYVWGAMGLFFAWCALCSEVPLPPPPYPTPILMQCNVVLLLSSTISIIDQHGIVVQYFIQLSHTIVVQHGVSIVVDHYKNIVQYWGKSPNSRDHVY